MRGGAIIKEHIIRSLRERSGYTQATLARAIGVSDMTIRRWESGQREPRASEIAKLCEVLDVSEAELLRGPAEDVWELRVVFDKEGKGVMDLTHGATSSATLEIGDNGMGITLSGAFPLWEDDEKFEDLISQLRKKRATGLKARKEGWA